MQPVQAFDPDKLPIFGRMAVIGVGLIGGSLGMAAKAKRLAGHVVGFGRGSANLEDAVRLGAIDSVAGSASECARDADAVFICTPVKTVVSSLAEIANSLKPGAICTDVGSTKRFICNAASELLPETVHFIGGHPMAGTERSGARFASVDLFQSATYVLTPDQRTDCLALETLSSFVSALGAECVVMDPENHDRSVAAISHLPHIIASSLLQVAQGSDKETDNSFKLAAGSFRDLTRIADSPSEIWTDICLTNADIIADQIEAFEQCLHGFTKALRSGDEKLVRDMFEQGRAIRRQYLEANND